MLVIALLLLLATGLAQDLYELDSIYRRHPLYRDYYALDSTGDIAPGFTQSPNLKHVPRFDIFEDSTTDVLIPRSIEKRKQYLDHRELLTVVEKMLRRTLEHGPTHVLCHSYNWRNFDDHRVTDMTDYRNKYLVTKEYGRHYALIVSEVDSEGFHGTVLELAVDWQQPGSVGPERGKHKNLFNHPEPFQDTSATRGSVLEYVGTTTKTDDELIKAGEEWIKEHPILDKGEDCLALFKVLAKVATSKEFQPKGPESKEVLEAVEASFRLGAPGTRTPPKPKAPEQKSKPISPKPTSPKPESPKPKSSKPKLPKLPRSPRPPRL